MPKLVNEKGSVLANEQVGPNLYMMELSAPTISKTIEPGQFVHMLLPGMEAHILRRPFSVYAANADFGTIEVLYQIVGFGSNHMAGLSRGAVVEAIGPIGSAWHIPEGADRVLLVAGGVGAAPLFMLAERLCKSAVIVDAIMGAQTKDALVCRTRYEELFEEVVLSSSVRCSTDDGSFGHAGFCTSLVEEALATHKYDYAALCGPEPMMKIAVKQLLDAGVVCEVSLERRMACGIGACLSCVVQTTEGLKRACVDGPIFEADKVVF